MPQDQPQVIILFGRSGCGKGTQAKLLQEEFGFDYLGIGDLVRAKAKENNNLGQEVREVLERGGRVKTAIVFNLLEKAIRKIKEEKDLKGLIIDGSPRSAPEAKMMDNLFKEFGWTNIKIILLDISAQEAFNRLIKRQRKDDTVTTIKARQDYFKKDVQLAVDFYQKQNRLIKINGQQSIKGVYEDIKKAI